MTVEKIFVDFLRQEIELWIDSYGFRVSDISLKPFEDSEVLAVCNVVRANPPNSFELSWPISEADLVSRPKETAEEVSDAFFADLDESLHLPLDWLQGMPPDSSVLRSNTRSTFDLTMELFEYSCMDLIMETDAGNGWHVVSVSSKGADSVDPPMLVVSCQLAKKDSIEQVRMEYRISQEDIRKDSKSVARRIIKLIRAEVPEIEN